jgi:formylglycine-generating enzyme required for sulfatase activity
VYEVTFEEYDRFTTATGRRRPHDQGWGRASRPVVDVSWNDAVAYAAWLSSETGHEYRLPSEAEWEYAARAGTTTRYGLGQNIGRNRASCRTCGSRWDGDQTAPAGSFAANGWGLHDMHGNVYEWVADCWHENYARAARAPRDPSAWTSGADCSRRVVRGGSWNSYPVALRSANRLRIPARSQGGASGFRVARTLD